MLRPRLSCAVLALAVLAVPASAQTTVGAAAAVGALRTTPAAEASALTFGPLDLHPHERFQPYFGGAALGDTASAEMQRIGAFRDLLQRYTLRMAVDDNFTLRVFDGRSGETLEVYALEAERRAFERGEETTWAAVDAARRDVMRRLIAAHARRVPRQHVGVHWGRVHQVREANEREAEILAYEVRLARALGLSLLATEVGTVETFNQDDLISSAGARSRYQMMPDVLRRRGVRQYRLRTRSGAVVPVLEEHHPLLTMESAFITLRAYINAVGHEVPGLSAYHSGPYNQFRIYRMYLERFPEKVLTGTVIDAFAWALTDGFEVVSDGSSFRSYSRGYVPALYGSLRAADDVRATAPPEALPTLRAEQVQLAEGERLFLSDLVASLQLVWRGLLLAEADRERSIYETLRRLNPHVALPESEDGGVPLGGNVRLTPTAAGAPVRFFLPFGATEALAARGVTPFDAERTRVFDETTFVVPHQAATEWDRAYADLVAAEARFGFTLEARQRLREIRDQLQALAEEEPTPYRRRQLAIANEHLRWWSSDSYDRLAEAVARAKARAGA